MTPGWLHRLLAATLGAATLTSTAELRAEWTEVATLLRPTDLGGDGTNFGERAVACGSGSVLVGASGEDGYHGAVYAFSGPGYASVQRLTQPDAKEYTLGASLAISGDTFMAGSSQIDSGSVSIFVRQDGTWALQQTIESSGAARYGSFGHKVALRGDTAVVTAPKEAGDLGRIYLFRREAGVWLEDTALAASDGSTSDFFGLGFGFDQDALIAGAPTNPLDDSPRGAAYIFKLAAGVWSEQARLDLAGQEPGSPTIYFGGSADLDGDWAVVSGSAGTDVPAQPRVYVYQRSGGTWQLAQTILLDSENIGATPTLQGERLFLTSLSGEALSLHEYRLSGGQWSLRQTLPGLATSSAYAVCGSTLVRTHEGTIIVYDDPTAGADPTLPVATATGTAGAPSGGASTAHGSSPPDGDSGCSYSTGGASSGALGLSLLVLLGRWRARRSNASAAVRVPRAA